MPTYNIYFNSGLTTANSYTNGDNVSLVELTNSEQDYYQNGIITIFDVPSSQTVNDKVLIQIDGSDEFDGYVNRAGKTSQGGVISYNYQVVGKTYDLWRHVTNSNFKVTGTTSYIVSSMLVDFCPGVSGGGVYNESGTNLTSEMDLSDTVVGEAVIKIAKINGYRFYIDNTGNLQFYDPEGSKFLFTVNEPDIVGMPLMEQSDDNLVNDVLVKGGSSYSEQTIPSPEPYISSEAIPDSTYIASRFKAEDTRLSAVTLFLNRTTNPNQPDALQFEIWKGASADARTDGSYKNYDFQYISSMSWDNGVNGMHIYGDAYNNSEYKYFVLISGQTVNKLDIEGTTNSYNDIQYYAQTFMITGLSEDDRFLLQRVRFRKGNDGVKATPSVLEIRRCDSNNPATAVPISDILCSAGYNQTGNPGSITQGLSPQRWLSSNTMYAAVFHRVEVSDKIRMAGNATSQHPSGRCLRSSDSSSWSTDSEVADLRFKTWTINSDGYTYDGPHATTTIWEVPYTVDMIRVSAQVYSGTSYDYSCLRTIKFSASTDSGSTWDSVGYNDDNYHTISNTGKNIILDAFFKTGAEGLTPSLSKLMWEISSSTGTGYPVSSADASINSPVEWSDDVSWSATDIPYPPSYSAWKTYTSPKLRLTKGDYYWLIVYHASANSQYWSYYYDPKTNYSDGDVMYGDNPYQPTDWTDFSPDRGTLIFKLGWTAGDISARASNQASIENYGTHFRLINDSTITTQKEADALAESIIADTEVLKDVGKFTIIGRTGVSLNSKISSNLTNLQVSSSHNLVSYTQRINEDGFTTTLDYGELPFDITKELTDLKQKVYGET